MIDENGESIGLSLWKTHYSFYVSYLDAGHIAIYEHPKGECDFPRIINVLTATEENIQRAEAFCEYGEKHYQDLCPHSAKKQMWKLAQFERAIEEARARKLNQHKEI